MNTYYIAELQNASSYRRAEKIEAKDLTQAKRIASLKQFFHDTVLEIGTCINSQGFITYRVAVKNGGWSDMNRISA